MGGGWDVAHEAVRRTGSQVQSEKKLGKVQTRSSGEPESSRIIPLSFLKQKSGQKLKNTRTEDGDQGFYAINGGRKHSRLSQGQ